MSDESKKLPGKKLSDPPCLFGAVNVKTGDYFDGYIENDEMKFKFAGNDPSVITDNVVEASPIPTPISYEPIFHDIIKISGKLISSGWFKPTTVHELHKNVALYRRRNKLTDKNEYYYNDKYLLPHYIDVDAFEKYNKVIFLDDVPWENL